MDGNYNFIKGLDGGPLKDEHRKHIIEHDLNEIAETFIKFAKKQGLDFWRQEYA